MTEIEANSWAEARDLLGKKCDTNSLQILNGKNEVVLNWLDYAVHLDAYKWMQSMKQPCRNVKITRSQRSLYLKTAPGSKDYW